MQQIQGISVGIPLAFTPGMNRLPPRGHTVPTVVLSILCAPALGVNTSVNADVERAADKAYMVDAAFDVSVPAAIAWMLGQTAIRGTVKKTLDEARQETLARAAR